MYRGGQISISEVYNATRGLLKDIYEARVNIKGKSTRPSELLIRLWDNIFLTKKVEKILHFCHSQGTAHTVNALKQLPKEKRDRIIVISVAPSKVVDKELAYEAVNYVSKRDFVYKFDPEWKEKDKIRTASKS